MEWVAGMAWNTRAEFVNPSVPPISHNGLFRQYLPKGTDFTIRCSGRHQAVHLELEFTSRSTDLGMYLAQIELT